MLRNVDLINIPLPSFDQFKAIYDKETASMQSVEAGCVTFYDDNFIIQEQVSIKN